MAPRPNSCLAISLAAVLAAAPLNGALAGATAAGGFGTRAAGPTCGASYPGGGTTININKNVTVFKPVTITSNVNVYRPITINKSLVINKPVTINNAINASKNIAINKPVTINNNIDNSKSINIYKPVSINSNINITKNIDNSKNINIDKSVVINKNIDASKNINIQKNVTINKNIVINKGGGNAEASAFAFANAFAAAQANASATAISYGGSQYVTIVNKPGGNVGGELSVSAQAQCVEQDANVVKSIHAVCVDGSGREYPASHMIPDTWIDASYEGEIARCIPGAKVRAMVGDVAQSDQGLAGTFEHGETLACAAGEALVHYRGGMLKCARAKPVKDCTERVNLRRWGSGDFFFSYRSRVCVIPAAQASASGEDLSGMTLEGGVGSEDSGY
ncbi:MAG TPA: hypothetical protein VG891_02185 [Rhizomicrobium sp.]|nr:hypothetical protein [Rhizomicrobium sp.]